MTYLKQNILAAALMTLSMGISVSLGYMINQNDTKAVDKNCVNIKIDQTKLDIKKTKKHTLPQIGK